MNFESLRTAEKAALAEWQAARNAHTDAESSDNEKWEAWNKANTALFVAHHPEIAAEVEAINIEKRATEQRVTKLREKLKRLELKLPQYYLES